ncbi:hypothetical protein DVR09_15385 (plasmid) [Erythrobacter aureus]|uniref:Uncharacterized protein n=2 Tax=Erythrobacter aureus TaxID=2182384 RepID=A0A345YIT4_9SPHN|nr:hypothetical protein DVR09_15385 [Erythrobacter aureus]
MGAKLRQLLVGMAQMGAQSSEDRSVRTLVIGAAKLARSAGGLRAAINGIAETEQAQIAEAATWMDHEAVAAGQSGRFDSSDLRNWLAIAARAGVAAIPAREIASFTSDEYAALVGVYGLNPDDPRVARTLEAIRKGIEADYSEAEIEEAKAAAKSDSPELDMNELVERLHSAMDDIPEGWMVRSSVCGGDNLKALAGCGVTETFIPEVRFGPDLEVGPGWVRTGNRRRIDIQDKRTMQLYVRNDTVDIAFLARPWVVASRWLEGRDPHRAGTPIDIPGTWPAEWRAFVRAGKVVGVSAYYPWAGQADALSAEMALKVRELAQAMVDEAIANGQTPRAMDNVLARQNDKFTRAMDAAGFADGDFDCTLDFIEADEGLLFLEGGPGCGMLGGGHPCGFAGDFIEAEFEGEPMRWMPTKGVAFRNMDHVLIGEPKTWTPGDRSGAILSWDEVEALAAFEPA